MKRKFLYVFTLAVLAVSVFSNAFAMALDTTISWGVVPNSEERTPEPPKGSLELLKNNNGIFVKETLDKKVYFTFDLGYEAGYTAQVLDILAENNIKGIFFLCGNYLQEEDLIKRMIDEVHYLGNHTDKHKDLPALNGEAIKKDIVTLQENFKSRYSQPMNFFRPPQGRFNENVLKIANEQGLKTTLWSIAIVDWGKSPINHVECANKIEKRIHPGAVILFHITNSGTPKMLKLLIPKIFSKGYQIGDPAEL
ncbi:MAG: polysaccharide deacetylase family protein [Firmicutes bacterium]|nr:polysaccharide deacetylase family protein [Bacillota bacterium]